MPGDCVKFSLKFTTVNRIQNYLLDFTYFFKAIFNLRKIAEDATLKYKCQEYWEYRRKPDGSPAFAGKPVLQTGRIRDFR